MFVCAVKVRMMSRSRYSLLRNLEYLGPIIQDIAILARGAGAPLTSKIAVNGLDLALYPGHAQDRCSNKFGLLYEALQDLSRQSVRP